MGKTYRELVNEHLASKNSLLDDTVEVDKSDSEHEEVAEDKVIIFNKKDVKNAIEREFRAERKNVLNKLYEEDNIKPYATINSDIFKKLDDLAKSFANFSEVIELCKTRLTLFSLVSPKIISLPPILLTGSPGVGKTRFLKELAKILDTEFFSLDFSTTSSAFILNGGASTWADSKPGFISESIRQSRYVNPIILLDEIDKVGNKNYDPIGCFYSLLEPHTASSFKDEYLEIEMNMSKIIWLATANYPELIPAPIRSRMTEIHIPTPTFEQSKIIVLSIYSEIISSYVWGERFNKSLGTSVIDSLAVLSPRQIRKQLEKALANAAHRTQSKHKQIKLKVDDLGDIFLVKRKNTGIGFLAEI